MEQLFLLLSYFALNLLISTKWPDALSFTLRWNYFLQWAVSLSSELSASGIIMQFWFPGWYWCRLFLVLLMSIHCLFGVLGFGESEFVLSVVKVIAIIVFILAGTAIDIGAFGDPLSCLFGLTSLTNIWFGNGV